MASLVTLTINPAIDFSTSVDRIAPIRKLRCQKPLRDPGGGGINVARVVKRLGGQVTAIYPEGGDTGRLLRRLVDAEGIPSTTIHVAEETRFDFTVFEQETGQQFRFILPGPELAEAEWQHCLSDLACFSEHIDFMVASGSLAPGVPEDFYARTARIAKQKNAKFVLDTSGPPLALALAEGIFLVKPNLRELRELAGAPLDQESDRLEACREIIRTGRAEIVALTLGQAGALLVSQDMALRAETPPVAFVSAVGAGDSFLGGLIWRLSENGNLEDAFRYGVAAGTAAVTVPGTGLCRRQDVERLYSQISVKQL